MEFRRAQSDPVAYATLIHPHEPPAQHHRLILSKLKEVEEGKIKRLMIFAPPGSAKSTYASVIFPSWFLGRHPDHDIICASHTAELAERFGRKVRNILALPEYRKLFRVSVAEDNAAAGRWATTKGGEYHAIGVGGAIAGRRADGALVDDPIRSREDADSILIRDRIWQWYQDDLKTRLKPGGWCVIVQTRWHEDDLCGRLLEDQQRGGEQWHVVSIPMLAETNDPLGRAPGELLWPQWFRPEMAQQAMRNVRSWNALYQQRPSPDTGDYFERKYIGWYDKAPENLRIYGASDYAVTEGGGDYTVHMVAGLDETGRLYILDLWRGQTTADVWIEHLLRLVRKWKPAMWAEETGQIRRSIGPYISRRMQDTNTWFYRKQFASTADKGVRAQSIRARLAEGMVYFPKGQPWVAELVDEMMRFPVGTHDDQVDTLGLIGTLLDKMNKPLPPKPKAGSRFPLQLTIRELVELNGRSRRSLQ